MRPAGGGHGGCAAPNLTRRASSCTARAAFVDVSSPVSLTIGLDRCDWLGPTMSRGPAHAAIVNVCRSPPYQSQASPPGHTTRIHKRQKCRKIEASVSRVLTYYSPRSKGIQKFPRQHPCHVSAGVSHCDVVCTSQLYYCTTQNCPSRAAKGQKPKTKSSCKMVSLGRGY